MTKTSAGKGIAAGLSPTVPDKKRYIIKNRLTKKIALVFALFIFCSAVLTAQVEQKEKSFRMILVDTGF